MLISKLHHLLASLIALGVPSVATAEVIEGPAEVIDGDSLRVAGTEVRLFGVDAPEFSQPCYSNGSEVTCGAMAKDVFAGLIGSAVLTCQPRDTDAYGRIVAVCQTSGVDIGAALADAGWATAFRRYGNDYVAAELRARARRIGIWQWDFQMPEDYRAMQQAELQPRATQASPRRAVPARRYEGNGQCLIKGNHSRRGDWIYHLPGMPYYDATRAEAYFCTEAEAQVAGYRRAIVR